MAVSCLRAGVPAADEPRLRQAAPLNRREVAVDEEAVIELHEPIVDDRRDTYAVSICQSILQPSRTRTPLVLHAFVVTDEAAGRLPRYHERR
jgi:hypothetical protein